MEALYAVIMFLSLVVLERIFNGGSNGGNGGNNSDHNDNEKN